MEENEGKLVRVPNLSSAGGLCSGGGTIDDQIKPKIQRREGGCYQAGGEAGFSV